MNHATSRRQFLKTSAATAAAAGIVPYYTSTASAFENRSANDRPRVAQIGLGGMGRGDARSHSQFADIVALCDVDTDRLETAKNDPDGRNRKADLLTEYRKVLDRDDIDIVSIATCDHWHVKIAIEALQAGKHVFCQKPLTLTLEENQLIRAACKKYDRGFMVGTQQRSSKNLFLPAVAMVQKGLLGDIRKITVGINGSSIGGPFEKTTPPDCLDWNTWLGQTAEVDYIKQRCHGQFRWWYEYSGGKFTDWGAHHIDIATLAINRQAEGDGPIEFDGTDATHPVPFEDGYPTVDDCYNTSNDFAIHCKYADGIVMTVTSRGDNGITFEGTKGRIFVNRQKLTGKPIEDGLHESITEDDLVELFKGKPVESHKANFYRCLSEGGLPTSDVFSHVQAMAACHLCGIAARLNRVVRWDAKNEQIVGDDLAASFFGREQREGFELPTLS